MDAKISTIKYSNFRKALLDNCKKSFNNFFQVDKVDKDKNMDEDQLIKFKLKLFGNIQFVGELNRRQLLQEAIIISVFDMLLAFETKEYEQYVNDNTIEGACVLMEKIGYLTDEKLKKIQSTQEKTEQKRLKNEKMLQRFTAIFAKFEVLAENGCSLRVRMILKNMLENRASGWERTKKQNEAGPKKLEELRRELEEKHRLEEQARMQAEMDDQYLYENQNQNYRDYPREAKGGRRGRETQYYKKKDQF